jgi:hypothetical protein
MQVCNQEIKFSPKNNHTANVYRGFLQYMQGKPAISTNISLQSASMTRFSLQILQKKALITL